MINSIIPSQVKGLGTEEQILLQKLLDKYNYHDSANQQKDKYYEGHIALADVNLGIALPDGMSRLEVGCSWGAKTVDVLAARSMFDGYVSANGNEAEELNKVVQGNNLLYEYMKACRDELKYGCTFATLSADDEIGCKIRFHSPRTSAALWDGEAGGISCGFAVIDTKQVGMQAIPTLINLYTREAVWVLRSEDGAEWYAEAHPQKMGRPLMEPIVWNATSAKPLGRSRIKEPIRRLIDGYVRTIADAAIGLEFATAPQKYILGVTDEQYDTIVAQKFKQYVGNILAATNNPETGERPEFGQLSQGNIAPHTEMIRILATQYSAATGLTVTDTGVVNDANPTSSDAILAQSQTLVSMAEQLNAGNGDSLRTIALMALAIINDTDLNGLTEDQKAVIAHFKNPAMPSVAVTADAAIKIASAREDFAQTDTFLEMIGFDQADIRRIKAQEERARGMALIDELANEDITEGTE